MSIKEVLNYQSENDKEREKVTEQWEWEIDMKMISLMQHYTNLINYNQQMIMICDVR